jgi:hypothetical protein
MSNRPKKPRVVNVTNLFPTKTLMTPAERVAVMLDSQLRRAKHDAHYEDVGPNMGQVSCTCGFIIPAPFGEAQGAIMIEDHYARFHVIHDPLGAKYRN